MATIDPRACCSPRRMALPLAGIPLGVKDDNGQAFADRRVQYLRRPVRRPVVNDEDFARQREIDSEEPIDARRETCATSL